MYTSFFDLSSLNLDFRAETKFIRWPPMDKKKLDLPLYHSTINPELKSFEFNDQSHIMRPASFQSHIMRPASFQISTGKPQHAIAEQKLMEICDDSSTSVTPM